MNNVINLIQNILEENKKNRIKNSDNNDYSNVNLNKNNNLSLNKNNNNYYSNVHIKAITNIKELISNNSNNNSIKEYNNNDITFNNDNIPDNKNNENEPTSFLKKSMSKKKNIKSNRLYIGNRTLNKTENLNKSQYSIRTNNYDIKTIMANRRVQKDISKKTIHETNNDDKKSNSRKDENSNRMSLKSYIKKVKNMYILKKLSNDKKIEIKNKNERKNINNISLEEEDKNNKNININKSSYIDIKKFNLKEKGSKKNLINIRNSNNNFINKDINDIKLEKKNNNTLNKDIKIKNNNNINNINTRNREKSANTRTIRNRSVYIKGSDLSSLNNNSNKIKNQSMEKKNNNRKSLKNIENLTKREKCYYILSKSPILRLTERLFFGRATPNLRNIQSISIILNKNEIFLKNKIKELEEKLVECNKKITAPFNASKTAEIAFNFILRKDEDEFRSCVLFSQNEEEKKEYYNYIKIIYLLFDENYENIELRDLIEQLYDFLEKKGYECIKDYLYYIFITKKEKVNIIYKIDKINNLLEESPGLVNKQFDVKFCRFVLFTSFLINEIIHYGNDIKNAIELEIKTKEYLEVVSNKLELYRKSHK